jgi:hydrogenase expression/formation protein HypD
MKYVDEYRADATCRRLIEEIRRTATHKWTIMEVCGGQTHSLLRFGIEDELADVVELLHGPGCPVCVTSQQAIDFVCELALHRGVMVTSFGDMLRVPGTRLSLQDARTAGGLIRPVYSPLDAVQLARQRPDQEVVFFAVGFETTAPATALSVLQAHRFALKNFSQLVAHVRVQPAMEQIAVSPGNCVQGFLAAGHVCTITGCSSYVPFVERFRLPVVVTGFEPVDLLAGILECVRQLESGRSEVSNQYARSVRTGGNAAAQELVEQVYEVCDRAWRGMGVVPSGGLRLRNPWSQYDAEKRFPFRVIPSPECGECRSGDILTGRMKPPQCPQFRMRCTPENPLGAPMVSSEGACAAYYRYQRAGVPEVAGVKSGVIR